MGFSVYVVSYELRFPFPRLLLDLLPKKFRHVSSVTHALSLVRAYPFCSSRSFILNSVSFLASGVSGLTMFAISVPAFMFCSSLEPENLRSHWRSNPNGVYVRHWKFVRPEQRPSEWGWRQMDRHFTSVVFAMTDVSTSGIVGKIYATEIPSQHTRAAAHSVAQRLDFLNVSHWRSRPNVGDTDSAVLQLMSWLVGFAIPIFLASTSYGPYFLFTSLSLTIVIVLAFTMPETRGDSLETVQEACHGSPTEESGHPIATGQKAKQAKAGDPSPRTSVAIEA